MTNITTVNGFLTKIDQKLEVIKFRPAPYLILIIIVGFSLRMFYFPYEIPITLDGLQYFWYAMDMSVLKQFPSGYIIPNNGWPAFVSVFFSLYNSNSYLDYMYIQRLLSITISVLTVIPVYFLCRRFFSVAYSLIGATFVIFEPRLVINSLSGITESSYILLGATTLFFILSNKIKYTYVAFGVTALFTLVRYEGVLLIIPISVMFLIKFRKEKKIVLKYLAALCIFLVIITPMAYIRMETSKGGHDGIVSHAIIAGPQYYKNTLDEETGQERIFQMFTKSITYFIQYLGWVLIPLFVFFVPIGIILIFKNRDLKNLTLIFVSIIFFIPALYAYSRGIQDTKYFYVMYPIFSIVALYGITKIDNKFRKPNIIWLLVIIFIFSSSILFLSFKDFNYERELESFKIAELVVVNAKGVNDYYPESKYYFVSELSEYEFPTLSSSVSTGPTLFATEGFGSLEGFIERYRDQGLTHLVVDNSEKRPDFLRRVFLDEKSYPYLIKEFDSHENGFTYYVKVYRINYDEFDRK